MIGFIGTSLYLFAYAYLTFYSGKNERIYVGINAIAAGILAYTSFQLGSGQAVLVNGFWLIASLKILWFGFSTSKLVIPFKYYLVALLGSLLLSLFLIARVLSDAVVIIGWFSAVNFCFAYYLFLSRQVTARQYHILNMLSAGCIIPALWIEQNWPVVALELCWVVISVHGVLNHREHTIP
ncbi:hypothetical protein C9928_06685 [Pseudidiomarina aestuarii]|uniref:CBU-0592-like domain-containing protein n=1 Tax=Pseudidiomarina aestuarii TaxID=624146 RepID=A0A2T4D375_9GAMM|nr:hypothetical protein C9988_00755 [Pseudidiomarina aestuarii]PTB88261.1 hypothetical protein C9928_06685 [Pseudidiomarina aestuarii]